jgi:hypothetical protein
MAGGEGAATQRVAGLLSDHLKTHETWSRASVAAARRIT